MSELTRCWCCEYVHAAFVVPLMLIVSFELSYLVHKRRSANFFCCITFDEGHRRKDGLCQQMIRYSVWLGSFLIFLVSTIADARFILAPATIPTETARLTNKSVRSQRLASGTFDLNDFVDVVPAAIGIAFVGFIGVTVSRYGTSMSTDVSATYLNRWSALVLAVVLWLGFFVGQPCEWPAPYLTNAGEVAVALALVWTTFAIADNLRTLDGWDETLRRQDEALAAKPTPLPPRFRKELAPLRPGGSKQSSPATPSSSSSSPFGGGGARGAALRLVRSLAVIPRVGLHSHSSVVQSPSSSPSRHGNPSDSRTGGDAALASASTQATTTTTTTDPVTGRRGSDVPYSNSNHGGVVPARSVGTSPRPRESPVALTTPRSAGSNGPSAFFGGASATASATATATAPAIGPSTSTSSFASSAVGGGAGGGRALRPAATVGLMGVTEGMTVAPTAIGMLGRSGRGDLVAGMASSLGGGGPAGAARPLPSSRPPPAGFIGAGDPDTLRFPAPA